MKIHHIFYLVLTLSVAPLSVIAQDVRGLNLCTTI
jgi:hypothetical protein